MMVADVEYRKLSTYPLNKHENTRKSGYYALSEIQSVVDDLSYFHFICF